MGCEAGLEAFELVPWPMSIDVICTQASRVCISDVGDMIMVYCPERQLRVFECNIGERERLWLTRRAWQCNDPTHSGELHRATANA